MYLLVMQNLKAYRLLHNYYKRSYSVSTIKIIHLFFRFPRRLRPTIPFSYEALRLPTALLTTRSARKLTTQWRGDLQPSVGLPFGVARTIARPYTGILEGTAEMDHYEGVR